MPCASETPAAGFTSGAQPKIFAFHLDFSDEGMPTRQRGVSEKRTARHRRTTIEGSLAIADLQEKLEGDARMNVNQ
jgi:hypothetical protein